MDETVTTDILCNACGKSCRHAAGFYGLIEAEAHGGYFSKLIPDQVTWTFSLCEECLKNLKSTFKIPVSESGGIE